MFMFSEDIVDISISAQQLADGLALMPMSTCPLLTGHYSDINTSIRRMQGFDILMLMSWPSSLAPKLLLCLWLHG